MAISIGPSSMWRSMRSTIQPTSRPTAKPTSTRNASRPNPSVTGGDLATHDHGDAELEREQAAGIVDQALAFENVDDALGQSDAVGDGGGGDGVGRSDNRSEDEAESPVEAWEEPIRSGGYSEDREPDQTESKQ
jgi:hypothetical protein